jgi:hypothetical protein
LGGGAQELLAPRLSLVRVRSGEPQFVQSLLKARGGKNDRSAPYPVCHNHRKSS